MRASTATPRARRSDRLDVAVNAASRAASTEKRTHERERRGRLYIDKDTTDAFLDKPPLRYSDGSATTWEDIQDLLDRAERGEIELPKLPPPTDH
jgi:hypothetical protein